MRAYRIKGVILTMVKKHATVEVGHGALRGGPNRFFQRTRVRTCTCTMYKVLTVESPPKVADFPVNFPHVK